MFETGINNLPSKTHTTRPETIGSSIIAIKYDEVYNCSIIKSVVCLKTIQTFQE